MDSSPPGSSVHRILQATILEWAAISFSQKNDYLTINLTKRERRIIKIINPDKLDFIAISQQANAPAVTTSKKINYSKHVFKRSSESVEAKSKIK